MSLSEVISEKFWRLKRAERSAAAEVDEAGMRLLAAQSSLQQYRDAILAISMESARLGIPILEEQNKL